MNYLITGGCGFIGTNLALELSKNNHCEINIIDNNLNVENVKYLCKRNNIYLHHCDIRYPSSFEKLEHLDIDYVIHLAAQSGVIQSIDNPIYSNSVNVCGTLNLLEYCRFSGVKRFLFASSSAVLGDALPPFTETQVSNPLSPYGVNKLAGEAYCKVYNDLYGLNTTMLRFSNVYGPYSKHKSSVVSMFLKRIAERKPIIVFGDGNQTRDYIYVKDLINVILLMLNRNDLGGEIFQVGTGKETNLLELIDVLKYFKNVENVDFKPSRKGETLKNYSCIDKLKEKFNWTPSYTLKEGIEETIRMWGEI